MGLVFCFDKLSPCQKRIAPAPNPEGHFEIKMLTRGATRAFLGLRAAAKQQMVPVRNFRYETVVSGPPRTPISTAEKIVHFGVICVAFFATPGTLRTNAIFCTDYLYSYVNPLT